MDSNKKTIQAIKEVIEKIKKEIENPKYDNDDLHFIDVTIETSVVTIRITPGLYGEESPEWKIFGTFFWYCDDELLSGKISGNSDMVPLLLRSINKIRTTSYFVSLPYKNSYGILVYGGKIKFRIESLTKFDPFIVEDRDDYGYGTVTKIVTIPLRYNSKELEYVLGSPANDGYYYYQGTNIYFKIETGIDNQWYIKSKIYKKGLEELENFNEWINTMLWLRDTEEFFSKEK